jgi:hypothetical protein
VTSASVAVAAVGIETAAGAAAMAASISASDGGASCAPSAR